MSSRWLICCFVLAACTTTPTPDSGTPDSGTPNPWHLVHEGLPGTLLSAWESSDGVLYAVGGTSSSALILRHDSSGWWTMDPGTTKTLWWVHGFSANDVYAVGANGVVTHFDGTRWIVEREGGDFTLFGAWGATPDELIAVGGVVSASAPRPAMVTKAAGWNEIPTNGLPPDRAIFKVWGTSANDIVIVGERGLIARGAPGRFVRQTAPTTERITTVHGSGGELYAVGGLQMPVMLRGGLTWRALNVPGSVQFLNGVAVSSSGDVVVVGYDGYVAEGRGDEFTQMPSLTRRGLHGAAVTSTGFVAVGGELLGAFGQGVVLSRGALEGGALRPWPNQGVPYDAGVMDAGVDGGTDAGEEDAGVDAGPLEPPDGGWLGPGASCDGMAQSCEPPMQCWFVFGPYKNFCGDSCTTDDDCAAYGVGSCCRLPGPQVTTPVCLPRDAGVCDAG